MDKQNAPTKAIQIIAANDRHDEVLGLMQEYVDWFMENDEWMSEVLANQHLEDEVADFNTKYAPLSPKDSTLLSILGYSRIRAVLPFTVTVCSVFSVGTARK